jgi:peptide/nickel transport system permease protein
MRLAELQFSFPFIVIAIAIVAVFGPSMDRLIVVLILWGWVTFARVIYAQTLAVSARDFVEAARALGASDVRIVTRHLLPNVRSSALVIWTLTMAQMLISESSLSFLGLGVPPPAPSWGTLLADARNLMSTAWWLTFFPGLAIVIGVLAINMLGDGLRDLWDPRMRT